jgi:putative transposase
MRKTFRYQLNPNKTQTKTLEATLRLCCCLYNDTRYLKEWVYKVSGTNFYSYPFFKHRKPYNSLYSQVLCDVLNRVDKTYQNFFRRVKQKQTPGYPRYKSHDRYNSFTYPQAGFKIDGNRLYLSKIGHIKINLHRSIEGEIKTCTIRRQCGKWYACFSCEVKKKPLPPNSNEIGIDVGLMSFIATSKGEVIKNPRHFKKNEKKLVKLQQSLSRKKRGSKRRYKTKLALRKAHEKVRNQREDFQHKKARKLVNNNELIAIEDLNVKRMVQTGTTKLSKSINETSWQSFIAKLLYKAEEAGRLVIKVNPAYTSQTCLCGAKVPKTLYDRKHVCKECGLVEDRDIVSAQIILQRARAEPSYSLRKASL